MKSTSPTSFSSESSTQFSFVGGAGRGPERRRRWNGELGPGGRRRHDSDTLDRHDHWANKSKRNSQPQITAGRQSRWHSPLTPISSSFRPIMRTGYTAWRWSAGPDTQRRPQLLDLLQKLTWMESIIPTGWWVSPQSCLGVCVHVFIWPAWSLGLVILLTATDGAFVLLSFCPAGGFS